MSERRSAVVTALGWLVVLVLVVGATAVPAEATVFSTSGTITTPCCGAGASGGAATPYPSTISVSGLTGNITDVNVTLPNLSHGYPPDLDILLVGPFGQDVVVMADVPSVGVNNINLTFDDSASGQIPPLTGSQSIASGTYKPTNGAAFSGTSPAPAGPYGSQLSIFNGTAPNGTWSLYVYDDQVVDWSGSIGGWSLDITTNAPTVASFSPAAGKPGTQVVITGTNLTGATGVAFGGVPATSVVANSSTQVTATVPKGAATGPVSVTTPAGTASSTSKFVVNHPRHVSLSIHQDEATGAVTATDGFGGCEADVPISLQHFARGKWRSIASVTTSSTGSFSAGTVHKKGKYRALAKRTTLPSGDVCLKDLSPVRFHHP